MALAPEGIEEVIAAGRLNIMARACKRWFDRSLSQFDERAFRRP
jgi:hypothetical protein